MTLIFKTKPNYQAGQTLILASVLFAGAVTAVMLGVTGPAVRQAQALKTEKHSTASYFLAEAGTEDTLYRLKNGLNVPASNSLVLNGGTANITVTDVVGGKTVTTKGNQANNFRTVETKVVIGTGIAFNYGLQVGQGGLFMMNSSGVEGNVYANGNITGENTSYITGSAIAANSAALTTDQSNETPTTPTQSIIFRQTSANQDLAQSFQVSTTSPINKIQLYLKKTGNPANATVNIVSDSSGSPSDTVLATGDLSASLVTTSYGWVEVVLSSNPELVVGTTYWLVLENGSKSSSNYYTIGANTAYTSGQAKIGQFDGAWSDTSPAGLDSYFRIFLGGLNATIQGVNVGTGAIGDTWAHNVTDVTVQGNLFCQTGSDNNKACDTSKTDPAPQPFPISDGNITDWKNEAVAGQTINGDYYASTSVTMGPTKIVGDLSFDNNVVLTLTGTLWVTGKINLSNNGIIKLANSYGSNSGVVVSDGPVLVDNNASFAGSGQPNSYILMVTTSDCPTSPSCDDDNAIDLSNNAGTVILNAQKGTLFFSNGSGAKEAVAYQVIMDNNSVLTYETGLVNQNFISGPSGVWNVTSWKEVQ